MNDPVNSFLSHLHRDESGQVLPWMVFLMVLFGGMAGITVDLGHAYVCHRELQSSTDAAALAGAYAMTLSGATTASVTSQVNATSSLTNGSNANPNLTNITVTPTFRCVTDSSIVEAPCSASPTGYNVLQVVQTSVVPTYFIRVLSVLGVNAAQAIPINAVATATPLSGKNTQVNVAMVVDTTASMGQRDTDVNCNNTRIHCALNGVQTLLGHLTPCTASSTKTNCTAFDQVSLFTFPNVIASTASNDTTCPSGNPTTAPYSTPTPGASWTAPTGASATYQISDYLSDYSSNNQKGGSLNSSSSLGIATGASGSRNCTGMQTPGGEGTYYAGVIYAAQSSLDAAAAANPGSENIMIILSDGDANSSSISGGKHSGNVYGSLDDQCQQAISAAQYATAQGTTVYTIAYGASSSGCSTDKSGPLAGVSACTTMKDMASVPGDFYSDATASAYTGECDSANSYSLDSIFTSIAAKFTNARLVPNGIT
ncbi:MAG: VWA domain-containing protein [Terracidiphilus sp.]